jgi:quinol monooxygenase YgiN
VKDPTDQGQKKNIQTFLQERYLAMFDKLVETLDGVEGVLGYEVSR